MEIQVNIKSKIPIYQQIIDQILVKSASRELKKGDKLPTIRMLAQRLSVNPNTVSKAYHELEIRGIIEGDGSRGSFITDKRVYIPQNEKKSALKQICEQAIADACKLGIGMEEIHSYISKLKEVRRRNKNV